MSPTTCFHTYRGGDPVAEVVRSGVVESIHRGSIAVVDPSGALLTEVGDAASPVFARSAIKPVLAAAMLHAGWTPQSDSVLAVATASHWGEPAHVQQVEALLSGAGLDEQALQCPLALPGDPASRDGIVASGGRERRVYMTCSGKHAAMLATCVANNWDTSTYRELGHPLQQLAASGIEQLSGESISAVGIDGCGVPTFAVSLTGLARAAARLVEADVGTEERAVADAMRAHPELVEGNGRIDSRAMGVVPGLLSKFGAEGLHLLALPGMGAVAVKIDDGAGRASMPVALRALAGLGSFSLSDTGKIAVEELLEPEAWGGRVRALL